MGEERDPDEPFGVSGGYRERVSRPAGAVLWTRTTLPARPVLPDGCTDLIWSGGRLLVAGPDTGPHLPGEAVPGALPRGPEGGRGTPIVGLRFAPGQGPAVFGVPAHELRDQRVPLADLWPAGRVRELAGRLAEAGATASGGGVGRLLEETAVARLRDATTTGGRTAAVAAALARGRPVAEVARAVALSERQLHRLSLDAFGYGPKTLTRVLRLVRALDLARSGMPYAQVAVRAGYADQAHLAREVKSLAGAPMGVLLAPG
ncbi:helix-turn-helix transcriptional regulator [Streptomyces decoyicus]|uniref:helix-turn-helix transcriptional regulator n=1 Tax=Streptomyces decoyicus TaxID=249567 RepID=UPI000662410D|nr:helix-turn-helix transcriptional regulator [Streptomyces decoyicus]KOG42146.1 AraC family transcriptional regulator [Streptomyces decoyicus]QZY18070.1 helix-turn-helix transcriptional regulator [Streptomyces decoyicus]